MRAINLRLSDQELQIFRETASSNYQSLNSWIRSTCFKATQQPIRAVSVKPGEDIIRQHRDKNGRFIKR